MKLQSSFAALSLVLGTMCAFAQERLQIGVFNYAGLSNEVLLPAVETARRTFRLAGIDAQWSVCQVRRGGVEGCTRPLPHDGRFLTMNLMPRMLDDPAVPAATSDMAGYALTSPEASRAPRGFTFYASVKDFARKTDRPVSTVLGCVMAHEIAHMLGLGHESTGLMQPQLGRRAIDDALTGLTFTAADTKKLRAGVSRVNAAMAGAEVMANASQGSPVPNTMALKH